MTQLDVREVWPELPPDPEFTAQSRACAREEGEVPPPVPSSVPSPSSLERARFWATQSLVPALTAVADKPGTLLHAQPPTFVGAVRRHRECARHFEMPPVRVARMGYGYLHTAVVKPALNYLEWATASPLSLFIHICLGFAVWLGLKLGGFL